MHEGVQSDEVKQQWHLGSVPPPSCPRNNDGSCGAWGDDGALALLVPPLLAQQHQQWRLEMECAVRPRHGWGARYMEFWFWIVLLSAVQNRYIGELDKCK